MAMMMTLGMAISITELFIAAYVYVCIDMYVYLLARFTSQLEYEMISDHGQSS